MLEFALYLYLITIFDSIVKLLAIVASGLVLAWFFVHILWVMTADDSDAADFRNSLRPYLFLRPKKYVAAVLGLYFLTIIIPSKELGYIFVGLKFTQDIYISNQQDMDELTKLSLENLKQILKNNLKVPDAKSDKTK